MLNIAKITSIQKNSRLEVKSKGKVRVTVELENKKVRSDKT